MSALAEPQGEESASTPRCPCCELKSSRCKCEFIPVLPQGVWCKCQAGGTWWPWGVLPEDGRNKKEVKSAGGQ